MICDQGPEFKGEPFSQMLRHHGIHMIPTSVKNPQANAICECLHQTIGNVLRPLLHGYPPANFDQSAMLIDTALQTAAYSAHAAIHSSMKISPGALVFQHDMLLDIPIIADLHLLHEQCQALIDTWLIAANQCCISHDYQPGNQILVLSYKPDKLAP